MAFNRNSNRSSRNDDRYEDNRRSRDQRSGGNRNSSRGGRQQQAKTEYFPYFSVFSNENRGRRSLQVKRYETKNGSIEDILSLEQFLHVMTKVYYGELTLQGSLFESDSQYADMTGNFRFSEEGLEDALDGFEEEAPKAKAKKTPAKSTKKAAAKKPVYQEPEDEDEDEVEYDEADDDSDDLTEYKVYPDEMPY